MAEAKAVVVLKEAIEHSRAEQSRAEQSRTEHGARTEQRRAESVNHQKDQPFQDIIRKLKLKKKITDIR